TRIDSGISHFRTISRDNVTSLYGFDDASRIYDPDDPRKIFTYLLSRAFDDKGNVVLYTYLAENDHGVTKTSAHEQNRSDRARETGRYLKRVLYGNARPYFADWGEAGAEAALPTAWHFEVVLDYGDHPGDAPTPIASVPWPVRPDPWSSYRAGFEVRTYRR